MPRKQTLVESINMKRLERYDTEIISVFNLVASHMDGYDKSNALISKKELIKAHGSVDIKVVFDGSDGDLTREEFRRLLMENYANKNVEGDDWITTILQKLKTHAEDALLQRNKNGEAASKLSLIDEIRMKQNVREVSDPLDIWDTTKPTSLIDAINEEKAARGGLEPDSKAKLEGVRAVLKERLTEEETVGYSTTEGKRGTEGFGSEAMLLSTMESTKMGLEVRNPRPRGPTPTPVTN